MPNNISWNLQLTIHEGKTDEFRALAAEMAASVETEPGTLQYEWFIGEDGHTCHINERYVDSEAAITHIAHFGANYAERMMAIIAPTQFSVYGDPNTAVREALVGFGAVHMKHLTGFRR